MWISYLKLPRLKYWDVKGSNKLDPRKTNDVNGEQFSDTRFALFVKGMQPTLFSDGEFEVEFLTALVRWGYATHDGKKR
ncbi:hypothetical protein Tco_0722160 [Tanacetum coccineum]